MNMTQEQVAKQLRVSRQTISNWENNKNLPDLEMIVCMANTFHISLDELILGGAASNNMTEKLIHDSSEVQKSKFNVITLFIGTLLLLLGIGCIIIKSLSVEYVDDYGVLHENFFLLPAGFLLIACGLLTFIVAFLRNVLDFFQRLRRKRTESTSNTVQEDVAK